MSGSAISNSIAYPKAIEIQLSPGEIVLYEAKWSSSGTFGGLTLFSLVVGPWIFLLSHGGSLGLNITMFSLVLITFSAAIFSFRSKKVLVTDRRVIVATGIDGSNIASVPLDKIEQVKMTKVEVQVSAGSFLNKLRLSVVDPRALGHAIEQARASHAALVQLAEQVRLIRRP